MKAFVVTLLFHLGIAGAVLAQDGPANVAGISGLPLMPGLEEHADLTVVFDKPGGRIVDAVASGTPSPDAAASFYAQSLSEWGWQQTDLLEVEQTPAATNLMAFEREGERLLIAIAPLASPPGGSEAPSVRVSFRLSPL